MHIVPPVWVRTVFSAHPSLPECFRIIFLASWIPGRCLPATIRVWSSGDRFTRFRIFCVLKGSLFGDAVSNKVDTSAQVSHCFGALKIDAFRDPEEFQRGMDVMLEKLRPTRKFISQDRRNLSMNRKYSIVERCIYLTNAWGFSF